MWQTTYFIGDSEIKTAVVELVSELNVLGKKYGFDTKCGKTVPVLREIVTSTNAPDGELISDWQ